MTHKYITLSVFFLKLYMYMLAAIATTLPTSFKDSLKTKKSSFHTTDIWHITPKPLLHWSVEGDSPVGVCNCQTPVTWSWLPPTGRPLEHPPSVIRHAPFPEFSLIYIINLLLKL